MIGIGFGLLGTLVQFAIIAGVIYLIVRATKRRDDDHEPAAAGTVVRRVFQYALLFAGLMLAATGIHGLLVAVFESDRTIARDASELAVPLALTIVGTPLFAGLAVWSRRRLLTDPDEQQSVAWLLYLTVTLVVSLVVAIVELSIGIAWILGEPGRNGGDLAAACLWVVVWAGHWWVGDRHPPREDLRGHRVIGSAITLWVAVGFLIATAALTAGWLYDELFRTTLAGTVTDDLRAVAAPAIVGVVGWTWYWLRNAVRDPRTGLWNGYVLLAGVLPSLLTVLTAAGIALFAVLEWVFGSPETAAADHFAILPGTVSAALIALVVLAYHRRLISRGHAEARAEIDRVYDYLVTAVGLVATGVAATMLLSAAIEAIAEPSFVDGGSSTVDSLLLAVTLAVVGAPLWGYFWARVQRHAAADAVETHSPSRRLYLFLSFGLGGVAAVISLIVAIATVLGDVLDGELGRETLYSIRIPVALVVTIGAVAFYHWTVFREDRARAPEGPEAQRRRIRSVTVVSAAAVDGLAAAVTEATGARPTVWQRADRTGSVIDPAVVVSAIDSAAGERLVVLVAEDGSVDVFPVARAD